jgi:hypothetical protein
MVFLSIELAIIPPQRRRPIKLEVWELVAQSSIFERLNFSTNQRFNIIGL